MTISAVVQLDGEQPSTRTYTSVGAASDDIYNINATAILLGKGFSFNLTVTGGEALAEKPRRHKHVVINIS